MPRKANTISPAMPVRPTVQLVLLVVPPARAVVTTLGRRWGRLRAAGGIGNAGDWRNRRNVLALANHVLAKFFGRKDCPPLVELAERPCPCTIEPVRAKGRWTWRLRRNTGSARRPPAAGDAVLALGGKRGSARVGGGPPLAPVRLAHAHSLLRAAVPRTTATLMKGTIPPA